jgi:hypothetical protein
MMEPTSVSSPFTTNAIDYYYHELLHCTDDEIIYLSLFVVAVRIKFEGGGRALGDAVILRGGAIKGQDLFFDEMHVHIGKNDTSGSEHRINGQGYIFKMLLVYWDSSSKKIYIARLF